jgi:tetratricopeptide (TPR) repeat protein
MKFIPQAITITLCCVTQCFSQNRPSWNQLYKHGKDAYAREDYRQAEKDLLASKQAAESADISPDKLASIVSDLGTTYQAMARYTDAEPLDRQALAMRERLFGPESREAGVSMTNLVSVLLFRKAEVAEAETLASQAVSILEKAIRGRDNALVKALDNLGTIYQAEHRDIEAKKLCERALSIVGQNSTDRVAITVLNHLARLYSDEGDYARAEQFANRALQTAEQMTGQGSERTAAAVTALASLKVMEGSYPAAELLFQRALVLDQSNLGTSHP